MNIHEIHPGPEVKTRNPALSLGLNTSIWVGNLCR